MAQTIMAEGARNVATGCYVATGGGLGARYTNNLAAPGNTPAQNSLAFADALNVGRGISSNGGAGGPVASPVTIYVPSGNYSLNGLLMVWDNTLLYGEPSVRPTLTLASGSMTSGSNPFIVPGPSDFHDAYATDWSNRPSPGSTNNTFGLYIRDINFTVASNNAGCTWGVLWATAQNCGFRNSIITVTSQQAAALEVGWNGFGPGGGHAIGNIVTNGGQVAAHIEGYFMCQMRGSTFNGPVTNNGKQMDFISCTFGGTLTVNGSNASSVEDCTFLANAGLNISGYVHVENCTFATPGLSPTGVSPCIQYTSGSVFYNGSPVSGTDAQLSANGVVRAGTPMATIPTNTFPYPSAACVSAPALGINPSQVTGNTNDLGPAINTALQTHNEIFFPVGDYHINTTINLGPGQKIFGGGNNWYVGQFSFGAQPNNCAHCVLSGTANPILRTTGAGTGNGVVITSIDICSNGNAGACIWNADPSSLVFDVNFSPNSGNNVNLAYGMNIQSGGMLYDNGCVSNQAGPGNAQSTGMFISSQGPMFIIVDSEEYSNVYYQLNGAKNFYMVGLDGESGTGMFNIVNSSNIYVGAGFADNGSSGALATISNSQVSLWSISNTVGSGFPNPMVTEGGVNYGGFGPTSYIRFTSLGNTVPSVNVSAATVTATTAILHGAIASNGGLTITGDGFDWGTTTSYSNGHITVSPVVTSGSFSSTQLTGLTTGQTYHYRATADNAMGRGVSVDQQFTPNIPPPFVQGVFSIGGTSAAITTQAATLTGQTSGNTNVVIVSFHSITAGLIASVKDQSNNSYIAASPQTSSTGDSQAIYYFSPISSGSNTVTVTLNAPGAQFVAVRMAEYSGIGGIDVTRAQGGNGTTASVPSVNTTNINDVIVVGVVNDSTTISSLAAGYIEEITGSSQGFGGIDLQDSKPGAIVAVTAPTVLAATANWVENMVAFLPSGASGVPTVTVPVASAITNTTATLTSTLSSTGGSAVTADGFNYGLTNTPYSNSIPSSIVQSGNFTANLTGLTLATTYHCQATASNINGGTASSDMTFLTTGGAAAVPTFVQHTSTSSNSNSADRAAGGGGIGNPGRIYHFYLPNPSIANNCLILSASGRIVTSPTVTDNIGTNTWTLVKAVNDGTSSTTIFVCSNVKAGTRSFTVTFSANCFNAHFSCSEFSNVSTSYASTSLHTSATSTVSAGPVSGVVLGDLVLMCGFDTQNSGGLASQSLTNIAAGSGFTLLSADVFVGTVCQYSTTVSGTVTPTCILSGSTDAFNGVAVVLSAASQGGPLPPGIRVIRTQGLDYYYQKAMQFPSSGNFIYVTSAFGSGLSNWSMPAGWTILTDRNSLGAYVSNINSPTLSFTIGNAASTSPTNMCSAYIYDISGAAASPFDTTNPNAVMNLTLTPSGVSSFAGTTTVQSITPSTANSLAIFTIGVGDGSLRDAPSSIQSIYDTCWYGDGVNYGALGDGSGNENSTDLMSNADGYGHVYAGAAGTSVSFTLGNINFQAAEQDFTMSVVFKAAVGTLATVITNAATNVTTTTATLNGSISNNGSQTITSDGFDYGTTTAYGTSINATTVQSGAFSVNITGLTANTLYDFRAKAVNASGTAFSSNATFTTQAVPTVPLVAVANATLVTATTATLNGSITSTGGQPITADGFDWGTSTSYGTHVIATTVQLGAFSSNISGLTSGTIYHYRATANNAVGQGVSVDSSFQFVPPPLTIPGGFIATPISVSAIQLNWTISTGGTGAIHYEIWHHIPLASFTLGPVTAAGATTINDTGLSSGTLYSYQIRAVDSVGAQSSFSTTVDGPTFASLPGNVYASNYNVGGQNVGYFDNQAQNIGTGRSDGVDLKVTSDAPSGTGFVLGFRTSGEWTKYNVTVPSAATYSVALRYEANSSTGQFHVVLDGVTVIASTIVALTGQWDTLSSWVTLALGNVSFTSGDHVIQVLIDNQALDLNYLSFSAGWLAQVMALKAAPAPSGFVIIASPILSLEALGLIKVIQPSITLLSGISSIETFGTPATNSGNVSILEAAWIFNGAIGTPSFAEGIATVLASGISSQEAFGSPSFSFSTVSISLSGIISSQALGNPTFQEGTAFLFISSVPDISAIGSMTIFQPGSQFISQPVILTAETFGSPIVVQQLAINLQGISSTQLLGTPAINPGDIPVSLSGIGSQEALGLGHVSAFGNVDVFLTPILSTESFGTPTISGSGNVNLSLAGISSTEVVNNPQVTQAGSPPIVVMRAIDTLEGFGVIHTLLGIATINLSGMSSAEQFGIPLMGFPGGPTHMGRVL